MKSFFSLFFVFLVLLTVVLVGALLWYLSSTSEFSRKDPHPVASPPAPPITAPVTPPASTPGRR